MDKPQPNQAEIEASQTKLTEFIKKITQADGVLIPLPKITSRMSEPLYVSVRYGQDIALPESGCFYLNVDMFALSHDVYVPIGMRDYEIRDSVANGNFNTHQHLQADTPAHESADTQWDKEGLKVAETDFLKIAENSPNQFKTMDELRDKGLIGQQSDWEIKVYQKLGIGAFMTAVALEVLASKGAKTIEFESLTPQAENLWQKFGRTENQNQLDIATTLKNPHVTVALEKFI